ncbi:MAG: NAD(P)/FAD-dependent oxidoreductase [Aquabacterium sp.]|nr:NAD(P)/FAD-dependent oxidoreductase [Aquabacterium sp.]
MIDTDAVVIGAGPVGLFQLFQLGLLGIKAEIIDVLPEAGGQCVALYPDKPIYDIPGIAVCTGRELAQQLLTQAQPFMPTDRFGAPARNLHLGHLVTELTARSEGGFELRTDKGLQLRCRVIFVAAGAGAFMPRGLNLPVLDTASNVHYHLEAPLLSPPPWADQHVVISGGGDEALSAVLALAEQPDPNQRPAKLTLLHRRDQFQADPTLDARVRIMQTSGQVTLVVGMPTGAEVSDGHLDSLTVLGADGQTQSLELDHLLIRQGLSPKLGPLTQWGMALDRKQVAVSASSFESSIAGIYAVGDINTYPGKKRLLLCGFHEATLAAHHAAASLNPDAPQHLLYTTTSPLLHQRLGLI